MEPLHVDKKAIKSGNIQLSCASGFNGLFSSTLGGTSIERVHIEESPKRRSLLFGFSWV